MSDFFNQDRPYPCLPLGIGGKKGMRLQKSSPLLFSLLEGILTQPTAPFRESWVKRACLSHCEELGLPVHEDRYGNYWVGAATEAQARRASLVFVAHLDHPGIVIHKFLRRGRKIFAEGDWLGGGPMDIRNFPVKVFSDVNGLMVFDGVVSRHTAGPRGPQHVTIEIKPTPLALAATTPAGLRSLGPWGACLWYSKHGVPAGVAIKGNQIVTKAADDLIGVCALIAGLARAGKPKGVVALLTRAEESGFHGSLDVLERKLLNPKKTLMISIETSSQLPGAVLGNGPVVRLGDRATVFSPALVSWVQAQAEELARSHPKTFRFQRRVMDGGTCEATAFNCFDFRVAGISTPLHNYHNMTKHGRPEPEAVNVSDVEALAMLVTHIMKAHRPTHINKLCDLAFGGYRGKLMKNQKAHAKYL
jgi:endoglucanase